jgi:hypothetical protein
VTELIKRLYNQQNRMHPLKFAYLKLKHVVHIVTTEL